MAHNVRIQLHIDTMLANGREYLHHLDNKHSRVVAGVNDVLSDNESIDKPRKKLVDAATGLIQLVMGPGEYLDHLANSYQELTCVHWLLDHNVLNHLPLGGHSIAYSALASKVNVPEGQLKRACRMAVVNGLLEESRSSSEHVSHSRCSASLVQDEKLMSWARCMLNFSMPVSPKVPDATDTWGETESPNEIAFNMAIDTGNPFAEYLKVPGMTASVSSYVPSITASRSWSLEPAFESFDWASLPKGAKVVDIGGSHGQLFIQVANKFPDLQFIVQDLPETLDTAIAAYVQDASIKPTVKSRIQFVPHNLFKPQTVADAHVYFLRMFTRHLSDKDALVVLQHLRDVLKQNPAARIVVMDTILPRPGSSASVLHEQRLRVRDLMMRQVFNYKQREMEEWEALLHQAGLKLQQVTLPDDSIVGLLTARLAEMNSDIKRFSPSTGSPEMLILPQTISETAHDLPVIIIGAGIGGLCLAQALRKAKIPFHVFERDAAPDSRPQGYRLKIQAEAAKALSETLPKDIYQEFQTSCAVSRVGETNFNPFSGNMIRSRTGGGLSATLGLIPNYTVDRTVFRRTLLKGISDRVSFSKEMATYDTSKEGSSSWVSVSFKDGETVRGCFLVGADGLHSAVRRKYLPSMTFKDTGAACIYGKTPLTPNLLRRFPETGLRWMTVATDIAPMLQSCLVGESPVTLLLEPIRFNEASRRAHGQQLPPNYVYWALIGPEKRFMFPDCGMDRPNGDYTGSTIPTLVDEKPTSSTHASNLALAITEEWHPSIRSVLELQDVRQATLIHVTSQVPDVPSWQPSALVTLLGDAIHPMSPCGGVGANTAICDAASLAKVLAAANGAPSAENIGQFEADLRKRARASILRSEAGSKKMFGLSLVERNVNREREIK